MAYMSIGFVIMFVISFATGPGKEFLTVDSYRLSSVPFKGRFLGSTSANVSSRGPEVTPIRWLWVSTGLQRFWSAFRFLLYK